MRLKGFVIDIAIGAFVVAAILSLSTSTPLGVFNAKLMDGFLYFSSAPDFNPSTFVIKNTRSIDLNEAEIDSLITELEAADAAQILILDDHALTRARTQNWPENVYFTSTQSQGTLGQGLPSLQLFELNSNNGNYRSFSLPQIENTILSLLDSAADANFSALETYERFYNFSIHPDLLPNITADRALEGDLIQSLIVDKIVFVEVSPSGQYGRYHTADTLAQDYLSFVEMQALAVEAITHDLDLATLPTAVLIAGLIFAYFVAFFLLQVFTSNGILVFEAAQLVVGLLLAYLFFIGFQLVFPYGELFLIQVVALLHFLIVERRNEGQIVTARTAKLHARLNQRIVPQSFLQTKEPWTKLHILIEQHLQMRRSILLRRVESEHRLVEIHSLHCTIDDIEESRRDYQRSPYSDAIQTQRPYKIASKTYFKTTKAGEVEYIVPIVFAGNVQGFWALTIEPDENWNQQRFEQNVMSFAGELAELLYQRRKFVRWDKQERRWLYQIINLTYAVKEHRELDSAIELLERRLALLQNVFSRNSSALVLYNLFGQVLLSNDKMDDIATALGLKFFTMSAHDALVALTGESSDIIKQIMRRITLQQRTMEWTISSPKLESDYILRVLPIKGEASRSKEFSPFSLAGVLFEFIDVHSLRQILETRRGLRRYYFDSVSADFAAMKEIVERLNTAPTQHNQLQLDKLGSLLKTATKLSHTVDGMLELEHQDNELFPVNPKQFISDRVRQLTNTNTENTIQFDYQWTELPNLTLVSTAQLKQLVDAILALLVKDSASIQCVIRIAMSRCLEKDHLNHIEILFANTGYGMPQERLENLYGLTDIELYNNDNELCMVLLLGRKISGWGGRLDSRTKLGKGFELKLLLPLFDVEAGSHAGSAQ